MIIRLKGIKTYRSKGKVYRYHRATGAPLTSEPGTAAFVEEVRRLDDKAAKKQEQPGALGGLMAAYRASPEFSSKSDLTRRDYLKVMDYLKPLADDPLDSFTAAFVIKLRDKTNNIRKRRFANYVLQVLSVLFNWGKPRNITDANPCESVEPIPRPKQAPIANRAWANDELDTVLAAASPSLRTAIALAAFTGLREGDVVTVTWSAIRNGRIEWRQAKTGDPVSMLIHSELRTILDETPKTAVTIVTGSRGKPLTVEGLKTNFGKLIRRLTEAQAIGPGLTFHGLRVTAATMAADAGAPLDEVQALLGHRTSAMAQHYTKQASKKRRADAAIVRMEEARKRPK